MKDLSENNVIRFKNISKKNGEMFANFSVKGMRAGVNISATIAVDLSATEKHAGDPLEVIIEECAKIGLREFQHSEFQFESMMMAKA